MDFGRVPRVPDGGNWGAIGQVKQLGFETEALHMFWNYEAQIQCLIRFPNWFQTP
jgi:hypothetical protein